MSDSNRLIYYNTRVLANRLAHTSEHNISAAKRMLTQLSGSKTWAWNKCKFSCKSPSSSWSLRSFDGLWSRNLHATSNTNAEQVGPLTGSKECNGTNQPTNERRAAAVTLKVKVLAAYWRSLGPDRTGADVKFAGAYLT